MSDFRKYLNVYEFETVLPGCGKTVKFKPITTGQLKKLLVYENEDDPKIIEEALDQLIISSIVSEDFNIDEIYLHDRVFLLIEIRKRTKGEMYNFTYTCPKCKSQSLQSINLNDITKVHASEHIDNIITITDDLKVELRPITRGMQKESYNNLNVTGLTSTQVMTEMAILTYANGINKIITPDGEYDNEPLGERKFLLENISTDQYENISNWYENNNFGLDLKFDIKCKCGKEVANIPLDNFFF